MEFEHNNIGGGSTTGSFANAGDAGAEVPLVR
jgi:hypothetical protein